MFELVVGGPSPLILKVGTRNETLPQTLQGFLRGVLEGETRLSYGSGFDSS